MICSKRNQGSLTQPAAGEKRRKGESVRRLRGSAGRKKKENVEKKRNAVEKRRRTSEEWKLKGKN